MLFAAIPLALSIGLIFAVPRFESNVALFAYVLATLIVLRTSFIGLAAAIALIPYKLDRNEIRAELARRT